MEKQPDSAFKHCRHRAYFRTDSGHFVRADCVYHHSHRLYHRRCISRLYERYDLPARGRRANAGSCSEIFRQIYLYLLQHLFVPDFNFGGRGVCVHPRRLVYHTDFRRGKSDYQPCYLGCVWCYFCVLSDCDLLPH